MNPFAIIRGWFRDPEYRRLVAVTTVSSLAWYGLMYALGILGH